MNSGGVDPLDGSGRPGGHLTKAPGLMASNAATPVGRVRGVSGTIEVGR